MKLIFLFLALVTSVGQPIDKLEVKKTDFVERDWTSKDGVTKKVRYVSLLIFNGGDDVVKVIEVQSCWRVSAQELSNPPKDLYFQCRDTAYLSGRFIPGRSSWSNELPVGKDVESIRLVRVGTVEAK